MRAEHRRSPKRPKRAWTISRPAVLATVVATSLGAASVTAASATATSQASATAPADTIPASEYAERRQRLYPSLADGILLLQARVAAKTMEQWGFIQDPSFLYFTGLVNLPEAVLAVDGVAGESHLFVPPPPISFGAEVVGLVPEPGLEAARDLGLTSVRSWDELVPWIERRMEDGVGALYVDGPRRPDPRGAPPGLAPVSGPYTLWRAALESRFPGARFASAKAAIDALEWVKSPAEVEALRANAVATSMALRAVAASIRPGTTQRRAEAVVVATCIESGAQGPSFWPWIMSGPNAHMARLVRSFYDYQNLDRTMREGEVVRVDIGCGGGLYGGDVGRTLPVSGRFTRGQRETWELLVEAYRAGIEAMAPSVTPDAIRAVSVAAVESARGRLRTPMARQAAERLAVVAAWHMHGVGIESGQDAGAVLEPGVVLAYEPMVEVDGHAFYLEDMLVITDGGAEILSVGLPYTADEIEAMMATGQATRKNER